MVGKQAVFILFHSSTFNENNVITQIYDKRKENNAD